MTFKDPQRPACEEVGPLLSELRAGELAPAVAERLIYKHRRKGEAFFHEGEIADRLYFIDTGELSLIYPRDHTLSRQTLSEGCVVGLLSFITGARHASAAVASEDTGYWVLLRRDLPGLFQEAPIFESLFEHYLLNPEVENYLRQHQGADPDKIQRWMKRVKTDIDQRAALTPITDLLVSVSGPHSAAIAIWLGILLDGIPESLVLGTMQVKSSISLSLIAGLFLANYPEALSSSVGMREKGFTRLRVFTMWASLMLFTGVGAVLGNLLLTGAGQGTLSLVEGIAAGAMLTMIAQTMLPEAYFRGGNIVGFATLLGFLAAIFFDTLG